jgi:hypothetical protein
MKDNDLFWHFDGLFAQFPPCHQLTMVAKHVFNPEYAVNFGPASGGAYLSEVDGTKLEESYNNEITRSSAHFNLIPKG